MQAEMGGYQMKTKMGFISIFEGDTRQLLGGDTYNGIPVNVADGALVERSLILLTEILNFSINTTSELLVFRVNLTAPTSPKGQETKQIETWFGSVQAKLSKRNYHTDVSHCSRVNIIWSLESKSKDEDRYSVALLVNKEAFRHCKSDQARLDTLKRMVAKAWSNLLMVDYDEANRWCHYPETTLTFINQGDDDFDAQVRQAYYELSSLAKPCDTEDGSEYGLLGVRLGVLVGKNNGKGRKPREPRAPRTARKTRASVW